MYIVNNAILGQASPSPATNTTLYTVPSNKHVNANLFICNRLSSADRVRVAITKSGNTLQASNYILFDTVIDGNASINITGLSFAAGDFVTVYSEFGNCSFNLVGITTDVVS